jgi:hypothetical protein
MSLFEICLFLLSSITFFLIADFIYIDWFAINPYFIDPFLYWGTGEVFQYVKFHFSDTYYFRRWTITFINYLFSSIFDPYLAIYFKNAFLLIINLFLSTLIIFKLTRSFFLGLFCLIFFLPSSYYIYSIGNNYNQATGIFFINLLLLITFFFNIKYQYKYFFFFSFVIFLSLVTYQFLIYVILPIIFFWVSNNYTFIFSLKFKNFFLIILTILIGIFAGFILEHLISFLLNVKWQNLFIYSYKVSLGIIKSKQYAPAKDFYYSIFSNTSFIVSAIFISSTLLTISIFNKNKNYFAFSLLLILLTLIYLLDPFLGIAATFNFQTNFYLFNLCLLGLILLLDFIIADYKIYFKILIFIFIFLLSLFLLKYISINKFYLNTNILILILFSLFFLFFKKKFSKFFLIILFIVLYLQLMNNSSNYSNASQFFKNRDDIKVKFDKLSSEIKHATKQAIDFNPSQPRRLWILDNRPHEGWSNTISSLYGLYSAINVGYNSNTVDCKQIDWILMFPNSVLVTYGFDTEINSLNRLTELFKPCGSFIFEKSIDIENAHTFTLKKIN